MEEINQGLTVPLMVLVTVIGGWCIWLTKRLYDAERDIAVNTSNDKNVTKQIDDLKDDLSEKIDKLETHVNIKFERINTQFDKVFERLEALRK